MRGKGIEGLKYFECAGRSAVGRAALEDQKKELSEGLKLRFW